MKKILLSFLIIGSSLTSRAQCEFLAILDAASWDTLIKLSTNANSVIQPFSLNNKFDWEIRDLDGNLIFQDTTKDIIFHPGVPTSDTISACLWVTNINGEICTLCDSLYWKDAIYNWEIINHNPGVVVSVEEYFIDPLQVDGRLYDLLGRDIEDLNTVPSGTIYIRGRKKFVKF